MNYLSVCSGIEAASVAWRPLGWRAVGFSEIEKFPSAVLKHHYPNTPNLGDMTKFEEWPDATVDVLVGGTPCQSFSVAGLRKGLADPRGNLMLTYLAIAAKYRPRWLVWENVPGVLSSNGGRDFGTFLGGLAKLGYGFAYRVLDAQYVRVDGFSRAVPQRRRRVFVVGHSGADWHRAAAVLFERASLSGHSAPRRTAGEGFTHAVAPSLTSSGRGIERTGDTRGQDPVVAAQWPADVAPTLNAHFGDKQGLEDQHALAGGGCSSLPFVANTLTNRMHKGANTTCDEGQTLIPTTGAAFDVAHSLRAEGFDASEDGTGRDPEKYDEVNRQGVGIGDDCAHTMSTAHVNAVAHPYTLAIRGRDGQPDLEYRQDGTANAVLTPNGGRAGIGVWAVAFQSKASPSNSMNPATVAPTLDKGKSDGLAVATEWAVRRLTPTECERLMGFPDDFTAIPYRNKTAADGPRYKALGNSMAVNCMRWIGQRIAMIDEINAEAAA